MKIYFLSQDDLDSLKVNVENNLLKYKEIENLWIVEQLGHDPFIEFNKEVEDFILDSKAKEIENAKVLYMAMKNITDSEATDERLWTGLTHSICWDFMRESLEYDMGKSRRTKFNTNTILNRYFFNIKSGSTRKRSMYINTLSKMWWAGRLCFNEENKENPFEYLTLFETAFSHKMVNVFSSNILGNKDIRFAFFDSMLYIKSMGIKIKGDTMSPSLTYLNEIGGKIILDVLSRQEIFELLKSYIDENLEEIKSK